MFNIDKDTIQALKEIAKDKNIFRRNLKLQELVNAKKELDGVNKQEK